MEPAKKLLSRSVSVNFGFRRHLLMERCSGRVYILRTERRRAIATPRETRMLCRVVLGHVLRLASTDFKAHETIRGTEYTSVLGCADGSNQEFVVFDVTQVYPEYIMFYADPRGETPDCTVH
mmetsp:Transcript_6999/g.15896  ORF Transcript_6999/g.15896 Transcript_6999/m.15896 type:complete len:122 (+) Transcript_6999:99-464(+)